MGFTEYKTDSFDPTDKYRFETLVEAVKYAETCGLEGMVIELKEPKYSDKPFMFVANSWIKEVKETK